MKTLKAEATPARAVHLPVAVCFEYYILYLSTGAWFGRWGELYLHY
jgi:hypothetical protein